MTCVLHNEKQHLSSSRSPRKHRSRNAKETPSKLRHGLRRTVVFRELFRTPLSLSGRGAICRPDCGSAAGLCFFFSGDSVYSSAAWSSSSPTRTLGRCCGSCVPLLNKPVVRGPRFESFPCVQHHGVSCTLLHREVVQCSPDGWMGVIRLRFQDRVMQW